MTRLSPFLFPFLFLIACPHPIMAVAGPEPARFLLTCLDSHRLIFSILTHDDLFNSMTPSDLYALP